MANGIFGTKAILLSRVSTAEQHLKEGSPQLDALTEWAKSYNYTDLYPLDTIESGFLELDARKGWDRIFSFIEENPDYKTIIATEISRLARDEEVLAYVKKYLTKNKIQLGIKSLKFWLLEPNGEPTLSAELMFSIYSTMAHFEMIDNKWRKEQQLRKYRKDGYSIGGKRLFGYDIVVDNEYAQRPKKRYKTNDKEADEIKKVYNWYAYGITGSTRQPSVLDITKQCIALGMSEYLHSKRNVNKLLKEEAYTGMKITKNKKKNPDYWNYHKKGVPKYIEAKSYECKYEIIIERPLFDTVQELLKKRKSTNTIDNDKYTDKSTKHTTILSKLIVCPECGKYLHGEYRVRDGVSKHSYRCASSRGAINVCSFKSAPSMVQMDSIIWAYIKLNVKYIIAKKLEIIESTDVEDLQNRIENLQNKMGGFDGRLKAERAILRSSVSRSNSEKDHNEAIEEYDRKVREINNERASLQREVERLQRKLSEHDKQRRTLMNANKVDISSIEQNKEEMYDYVHNLIDRVVPVFINKQYTVLEVEAYKEIENYNVSASSNEILIDDNQEYDTLSYIFIDKRDTNRLKVKLVEGMLLWNKEKEALDIEGGSSITAAELFRIDWTDIESIKDLMTESMVVQDLPYKRLDFYAVDETGGK